MNSNSDQIMEKIQAETGVSMVLTPMDVAKVLGVSKNTVYEIFHSKEFPAFKVGKQYRVRLDRLLVWMAEAEAAA